MPVLSRFYGIVIRMLFIRHFRAHFHAFYNDCELLVGIAPIRILQGEAPSSVRRMVLEWASMHQHELVEAWNRLSFATMPQPIEPLA